VLLPAQEQREHIKVDIVSSFSGFLFNHSIDRLNSRISTIMQYTLSSGIFTRYVRSLDVSLIFVQAHFQCLFTRGYVFGEHQSLLPSWMDGYSVPIAISVYPLA